MGFKIFFCQWIKNIGEIEINIELHTKLFYHLKDEAWSLVPSPVPHFTQLSLEDTLIHLCGHLAFQHTFHKLYWLFDIYFYTEKYQSQIDWDLVIQKSKVLHLANSVQMCLWCLHKYFKLSTELIDKFNLNDSFWWKQFLTVEFLISPEDKKLNYFLIKHATKDHFTEAIWYDLMWFWHYKISKKRW